MQRNGPYHIVGYSYGALTAFELAVHLQKEDPKSVASLTFLDGAPGYLRRAHQVFGQSDPTLFPTMKADQVVSFSGLFAPNLDQDEAYRKSIIQAFQTKDSAVEEAASRICKEYV